jgi:hypothetical protein
MFTHDTTAEPPGRGDYVQPTLGHGLRVWWAFYWRNTLLSIVAMFLVGILLRVSSAPLETRLYIIQYGQYVLSYLIAIFIIRVTMTKQFKRFRIGLVSTDDPAAEHFLSPTLKHTLQIWWTYSWRTAVFGAALALAMSVPMGFVTGAVTIISEPLGALFTQLIRLAIAGVVGLFVFYSNILDEEFGSFRVILLPRTEASSLASSATAPPVSQSTTNTPL